ncbi:MAG: class I SAM-dependent RNA methyltransferase [Alphaproteobacteria bacterium]
MGGGSGLGSKSRKRRDRRKRGGRRRGGNGVRPVDIELRIEQLGHHGDGIGAHRDRMIYVPGALPGELVRARTVKPKASGFLASLVKVIEPSEDRVEARCAIADRCGGCAVQQLEDSAYLSWKGAVLQKALARFGVNPDLVLPVRPTQPGLRRRMTLRALKAGQTLVTGYSGRYSDEIVDLKACPLVTDRLAGLLAPLKAMIGDECMPQGMYRLTVTHADQGIDLVIGHDLEPGLEARETLTRFAEDNSIGQLSWLSEDQDTPEPICHRRSVAMSFGGINVALPPGSFVQAVKAAEDLMVAEILAALPSAPAHGRVCDLFAGLGTFSVPLAATCPVTAVESDSRASQALAQAARDPALFKPISVIQRDLFRDPLTVAELSGYRALIFDPPRAGAEAQAREIAQSTIPVVIAVSCNPKSFARDASILEAGGYVLEKVTPIDQFLWSSHLEMVGVFRRV